MSRYIVRGNQELSEEDLVVHLATVLQLDNVGALLGAGASVPTNGQTMAQLWDSFVTEYPHSAERIVHEGFVGSEQTRVVSSPGSDVALAQYRGIA